MNKIKYGGAAFPTLDSGLSGLQLREQGMTIRDYFAAKAMQGLLSADSEFKFEDYNIAKFAYQQADLMLAERECAE